MVEKFEDHCWQDVIPAGDIAIYGPFRRETYVGAPAALVAVDLYEQVYRGGDRPVVDLIAAHPMSCGAHAFAAIAPTQRLLAAARAAGLPVFYSTGDARPESKPGSVTATQRRRGGFDPDGYRIRTEFKPLPGDVVITKQRASAFHGTPLAAHLTQLGIHTVVMCGETTSGCVRASAVDAYSAGYHVVLAEECCFDRVELSHKVNLFDLHHKYADVMHIDEVVVALGKQRKAAE
ncbi:MAG TPA: isochorismatase family protein [Stellaceae bacterium]|nr:isochorismatase family protein [Stellaceae bacterium]